MQLDQRADCFVTGFKSRVAALVDADENDEITLRRHPDIGVVHGVVAAMIESRPLQISGGPLDGMFGYDVADPLCYTRTVAEKLTKEKLLDFLGRLGASARTPGVCFITGGSSAILLGWRETTIDVHISFDPEPAGVFDAIPDLKRELSINVELASPADFIPPLAQWRERCHFIGAFGRLQVFHYDFLSQALSKLERGHTKDLLDVTEMLRLKLVMAEDLLTHAEALRPHFKRYPAVDAESFVRRVKQFLGGPRHA